MEKKNYSIISSYESKLYVQCITHSTYTEIYDIPYTGCRYHLNLILSQPVLLTNALIILASSINKDISLVTIYTWNNTLFECARFGLQQTL